VLGVVSLKKLHSEMPISAASLKLRYSEGPQREHTFISARLKIFQMLDEHINEVKGLPK